MRMWTAVLLVLPVAGWAWTPAQGPIPPLKVTPEVLLENGDDIQRVVVEAEVGKGKENPQWSLSFTAIPILVDKLLEAEPVPPIAPKVLAAAKQPEPAYKGLTVRMSTAGGRPFEPFKVYNGRVRAQGGAVIRDDMGRGLEYWLFSTARVQRDVRLGAQVLPVLAFEQCRLLGMMVVATEPRQCVMPDETLLLETETPADMSTLKIHDFDSCLKYGKALLATFPRRCVAAGGRVWVEPPRVVEPPADAPLAVSATMPVAQEAVSVTVVTNPLLGGYVVTVSVTEEISGGAVTVSSSEVVSPTVEGAPMLDVDSIAPAAGPEGWGDKLLRWLGLE
ncbi:MAG: hypothetical protein H6922_05320 [Pseudomonadaceae bacterium]|nr:hypothetical protein [Pseudomonadaceae bacterium]